MGRIAIAAYRPKPGKEAELLAITAEHHAILFDEGLVTGRRPVVMVSSDGTVVEVFEWLSEPAIERAHSNPAVLALWERYAAVCSYVPLDQLPESKDMFATFDAVDFNHHQQGQP